MTVKPQYPSESPPLLALVGEAPGADEERVGKPFVGASGRLLDQMLCSAGIVRHRCFITNVVHERPPKNDFKSRYYSGKSATMELMSEYERLRGEILEVKPRVVVALGAEAMRALTGMSSLTKYRGTMIECEDYRVLPTYHPAYVLRVYSDRPTVEADLRKALRQAVNPRIPSPNILLRPTFSEVMSFLSEPHDRLSLDIETVDNSIRCIGLASSENDAICIPLTTGHEHYWSLEEEWEVISALDRLMRGPTKFYVQNSQFDLKILAREYGLYMENLWLDTMLAHHVLYPELPKGLDYLSSIYTDHPMYWDYDSSSDVETWRYNCLDCLVTFEVGRILEQELESRGLTEFYRRYIHASIYPLIRVQSRGVLIDQALREKMASECLAEMERISNELSINPSSPKQVSDLVYGKWGMPVQRKPREDRATTDTDALKALLKKTSDPEKVETLSKIIEYRQKKVLHSTFLTMPLDDGRVYTAYNLAGTVTGRLSSSRTIDGIGGNLQNIPRGEVRRIFLADPGKVLVKADLSQAEYRVLIWKANIRRVIRRFIEDPKFNIHMWNASENIYRVKPEEVTKEMYQNAKNGVYGANYGVGPLKVSRMYGIDFKTAKFIIERYHEAVPEVREVYQASIRDEVSRTRRLRNPFGRERVFFERFGEDLWRAAYSHYCQSTVADLVLSAIVELDSLGVEIFLQVHDELVCQVPESELDRYAALIKRALERPIVFSGTPEPLIIPAEVKYGSNWNDVKQWSPHGVELP